ncbi:hypothetical protein ABZ756_14350 [Mammaliicoccus sciuri]|uniref:Uncharacterized protein n=2 Tax=Sporosarcina newyorkensis TaxID=759851 RepID=A0A1T4YMQ6_9BACL|nr:MULTISPECIES: hypothetical protein [Sporosarcina]EGQ21519.1 hypothetical protein HMPREF9372_3246 [Sporosarcina newyorkensis 2681]MBY0221302.1 hypothetical protein [Sporosarcina aquimarina]SKB02555.1 hypothetical protein SAMN04244570_2994 [Sporosarcina newyorkensis]
MLAYLTIFSVFVFTVVMSAAIGFLFYQVIYKFLPSTAIKNVLGAGLTVLISCIMTKLLLLGAWYFYVATSGVAFIFYVVFIVLSGNELFNFRNNHKN